MNVLALYDIHGNVDALEAVLADERAGDADVVLVGGDAVPGPFAEHTLARLEALTIPVRWIRGNGEREVAEAIDGPEPDPDDAARVTAKLTLDELGPETARPLGDLPLTLELDGVLYCHATPRADDEMVTRISAPERYASVLEDVTAKTVVAGHTHQQHDVMVGAIRFLNAGSVGMPYEDEPGARWCLLGPGVELRRTAYDVEAAAVRVRASGFPEADEHAEVLLRPPGADEATSVFEGQRPGRE